MTIFFYHISYGQNIENQQIIYIYIYIGMKSTKGMNSILMITYGHICYHLSK
jgi:hypothetical protein